MVTKKDAKKEDEGVWPIIKSIFHVLGEIIKVIAKFIVDVFTVLEKIAKVVAILLVGISSTIFLLIAAFYLFTISFGLKESAVFQDLREQIAVNILESAEEEAEME